MVQLFDDERLLYLRMNGVQQKIVIEVPLHCGKCKKKVMTICTTADGTSSSYKYTII